jgi:hypothetical protein
VASSVHREDGYGTYTSINIYRYWSFKMILRVGRIDAGELEKRESLSEGKSPLTGTGYHCHQLAK